MRTTDFTSCPRTKAKTCECSSLSAIQEAQEVVKAVVQLEHTEGDISGAIVMKQDPGKPTIIRGIIKGLTSGKHGFHVHEFGDLSKGCESAGGHYNPEGVDHGGLSDGHIGDLGNIVANDDGIARFKIVARRIDLSGDRSIVGRAIVIHADEDDLGTGGDEESLKTGNAGDRLACGVVRLRKSVEESYTRPVYEKTFDRNQLPQIKRKHLVGSEFKYKEGTMSIEKIKPVQTQRVDGLAKKSQDVFLNNEDKPFIVDRKGYLINGHHRFDAANVLGIKKVPAIMIDADIEDVIKTFAHTTSDAKTMAENYFNDLLQSKMEEGDVVSGNFGGQADVPQLPHQEVLMAISSWEYGDTPIELSNGYVVNAYDEHLSADDNAWIVLDPQGNEYDSGTGSIVDVMQEFTPKMIDENFADGKVKGKSRPGRVKKSGASCDGSVTSLRKKAKDSSGEKSKMYHWCANMKSGKKKK